MVDVGLLAPGIAGLLAAIFTLIFTRHLRDKARRGGRRRRIESAARCRLIAGRTFRRHRRRDFSDATLSTSTPEPTGSARVPLCAEP